ncbi:MAG: amylo-alpha-1,6-glucosidase [Xenococcus sp. (in: cyanobacteria)]
MTNLSILLSENTPALEVLKEKDSDYEARFTVEATANTRRFSIQTTAPLEQKLSGEQRQLYQEYLVNPRTIEELGDYPTLESNHIWFDALYALAIEEVRQCSVSEIQDGAYNYNQPIQAPDANGFFQTGLFWTYVWTRDVSYSVNLSLAFLDPMRALNSLQFKLSERRDINNPQEDTTQIIQDTGTGGSYPISSDRVTWSFGCQALLPQLQGQTRRDFAQRSYTALKNTIEHDRQVIFDPRDGLYRGEQSFLDWREQSYPRWVTFNPTQNDEFAPDPVQIGMSKAISTNCCHYNALSLAANLAEELEQTAEQQKYHQWAEDLQTAIRTHLYLPEKQLYSTFITSSFVPGAANQYDLLGNSLAILLGIADETEAKEIVAHYPHLTKGAPVIWPQQRDTFIYHNGAIWPFVTSFWLKAAQKVKNEQAVTLALSSLIRGAALSLSNMENFEVVSGRVEIDSETKEPRVNSPRQLWSVAGYLSMIYDVLFGLIWTDSGFRIAPYITREFRNQLLPNSNQLVLKNLSYQGYKLNIALNLPPVTEEMSGAYKVKEIRLNGQGSTSEISQSMLIERNSIEVDLIEEHTETSTLNLVTNVDDYRFRFAPRPPIVESLTAIADQLEIKFNLNGENPDEVKINIYRDGSLVARELSGNLTSWLDPHSFGAGSPSYCYNLETVYIISGTTSQRSQPFCYWGVNSDRIYTVNADQFSVIGGNLSSSHGLLHYDNWGKPGHTITVNLSAQFSGPHAIQVLAGNGAGSVDTGITCAVKHLRMKNLQNDQLVADGYLKMPHLGNWDRWLESSVIFTKVDLIAGQNYEIKIFGDEYAINMSSFSHNANYISNGQPIGIDNYVNIAQVKLNALS